MTEKEFQEQHGLCDEELERIKNACKINNGKITRLAPTLKKWGEDETVRFNQ